jgi:hypothetical protein
MFDNLVKENRIWDAHIVVKNEYSRNLAVIAVFEKYFDFCIKVAGYPIEIENRTFFMSEAQTALTFFSENAEMSEDVLNLILSCREKILETAKQVQEVSEKQKDAYRKKVQKENDAALVEFVRLKERVSAAKQQKEFDAVLLDIEKHERKILKDDFNAKQQQLYDKLTKEFSALISSKMAEITRLENAAYNKKAVEDFKAVFHQFKADEPRYANSDQSLFALVNKRLFGYDAARLFNETMIYYSHVYFIYFR